MKPNSELTPLELSLDLFFPTFPKPPDVYWTVESAVLQNAGGLKVLAILLQEITHPPNASSNLYYFVRISDKEIKIIDANPSNHKTQGLFYCFENKMKKNARCSIIFYEIYSEAFLS